MFFSVVKTAQPPTPTPPPTPSAPTPAAFPFRDRFIALRPRQWAKNIVVFAGMMFAGKAFHLTAFLQTLLTVTAGFAVFCAFSSVGYSDQRCPRS